MNTLILDVKIYIASFNIDTWIKLMLYDEEFHRYAYTSLGLKHFIHHFTEKIDNQTYLFNKLHSIYDEPAVIYDNGIKVWYYCGLIHRGNDLPAVNHKNILYGWWYYGKQQRENNLPYGLNTNWYDPILNKCLI